MTSSIKLNYSHPNAGPAEYFINHTKEHFVEDKTKEVEWTEKDLIIKAFNFKSVESTTVVHILFFDSQADAIEFEKTSDSMKSDSLKSVLNGSVLYIIRGADKETEDELAGLFAGTE